MTRERLNGILVVVALIGSIVGAYFARQAVIESGEARVRHEALCYVVEDADRRGALDPLVGAWLDAGACGERKTGFDVSDPRFDTLAEVVAAAPWCTAFAVDPHRPDRAYCR